jgi:hypothetical protein
VVFNRGGVELISVQAADLGAPSLQFGASGDAQLVEEVQRSLRSSAFADSLDRLRDDTRDNLQLEQSLTVSVAGVSLGLSLVYALWLIRGGVLMGSYLSALPAWRILDPLPVLAQAGAESEDDEDDFMNRPDDGPDPLRGFG